LTNCPDKGIQVDSVNKIKNCAREKPAEIFIKRLKEIWATLHYYSLQLRIINRKIC
jgi:hypothetical protein